MTHPWPPILRRWALAIALVGVAGCEAASVELLSVDEPSGSACTEVAPLRFSDLDPADVLEPLGVGWTSDEGYLVAWKYVRDDRFIALAARLDAQGDRVAEATVLGDAWPGGGTVVQTEQGVAVVYATDALQIHWVSLDAQAAILDRFEVGAGRSFAVARAGGGYGLVYASSEGTGEVTGRDIVYFRRLDAAGRPQTEPIVLFESRVSDPDLGLAHDGQRFIVAYEDVVEPLRAVVAIRVIEPDGAVGPARVISGPDQAFSPAIASDGRGFLAAWEGLGDAGGMRFLGSDGAPAGAPVPVGGGRPRLVFNGRRYAAARTEVGQPITMSILSPDGYLDTFALQDTDARSSAYVDLSWDGAGYPTIWKQTVDRVQAKTLMFARVCR